MGGQLPRNFSWFELWMPPYMNVLITKTLEVSKDRDFLLSWWLFFIPKSQIKRKYYERGPTDFCPHARRLESITICWFQSKGSTFGYFKTWRVGQGENQILAYRSSVNWITLMAELTGKETSLFINTAFVIQICMAISSELTQLDGRKKRTSKRLFVTNDVGLFLVSFVVSFT